ncbi:MAG TPA: glycoside hydrolase family 20 zincin-like fold domain-containing protein [Candidatus Baltobacteraceae bacterium]|nr:glycoside hydrolase family 20 zincin-like fold domain-containing protein [Candidatus Baltobacteraceae bacterium]
MPLVVAAAAALRLVPQPAHVSSLTCAGRNASIPITISSDFDPAAREEIDERWSALGIKRLRVTQANAAIVVRRDPSLSPQAYRLTFNGARATIESGDAAGAFYGAMTLAQLPQREGGSAWTIPCVSIEDRPALRWRALSDDVSRGPLPTMRYFEERIRTIAAFKMNGYSPYMEHVFVSPSDPLPAPLDGITPAQLRDLTAYAKRFHVALIPEQQTFAHMHNTLKLERYAPAAELPHGFLLAPNVSLSSEYLSRIIEQELAAVGRPPFFHIGSDETATLGLGQTQKYVAQRGRSQAYADHIVAMDRLIAPSGARVMLWDDGIENEPAIMKLIPRTAVIVNWHYGDEASFEPYIKTIASGGFEQMVAPGASNWNEIYPNVERALRNESRFIEQGKSAGALGLFQTVWHDDGETLYEATWYPVIYAAAAAWQSGGVDEATFAASFPSAFFGAQDASYSTGVAQLGDVLRALEPAQGGYGQTDALFWADPFDPSAESLGSSVDVSQVRRWAETVQQNRYFDMPPLHANAAFVMFLAARRYDLLGRKLQMPGEIRAMYADALAHAATDRDRTVRDLYWCKYWMWELRDAYEDIAPLYARAWRYESRDGHLASNLERYHLAAQNAIRYADAFYRITEGYGRSGKLPPFDEVIHS